LSLAQPGTKQIIFSLWLLLPCLTGAAQPYLDIGRISYYYTPAPDKPDGIRSSLYSINVTLPFELKKDGDAIIVNPFFDVNHASTGGRAFWVHSTGIMAGFLKKNIAVRWDLMTSVIVRKNQQVEGEFTSAWQTGGLILATFKQNESRSFKVGAYYNREFFGNFFMPLIGIDWRINESTALFGVLPGSMTLERKVSRSFYIGAAFRALTNSYRLRTIDPCFSGDCSAKNYLRINDNQLGLFADIYFFKQIVFTTEAGHTIFRKYRYGFKGDKVHTYTDVKNDNWYVKGTLAYRLRFSSKR
jgi:hypothetical protein